VGDFVDGLDEVIVSMMIRQVKPHCLCATDGKPSADLTSLSLRFLCREKKQLLVDL
jgi:hypothetical protein